MAVGFRKLLEGRVEAESLERLVCFAELLERWSSTHNLVRFGNREELVERHILDALSGAHLMRGAGRLLDVGSGAGLPGVPLLVVSAGWSGVLLEPRQKRWAFLKRVIRELDLDAEAVARRYQELPDGPAFDLVTARAVGEYRDMLLWSKGRLSADGAVALWTSEGRERELGSPPGWRVLSWPLVSSERGRLLCFRPKIGASGEHPEGFCFT